MINKNNEEIVTIDLTENTVEANLFKTLVFSELANHFKNADLDALSYEEAQEVMVKDLISKFPYTNYKFILPPSQLASMMEYISDAFARSDQNYCLFVVKHQ